jgi:hypothetical protein
MADLAWTGDGAGLIASTLSHQLTFSPSAHLLLLRLDFSQDYQQLFRT